MAEFVYILGALTTLLCAVLLLRGYARGRQRLLLWSGLCFSGLTLSNILLFIDLVVLPSQIDLYLLRLATAALAMLVLVFGLIWESD
ncbi:hypothetical protein KU644_23810 [Salmonella enterica subsp. enterica serovar Kentucky]|nr:hypothetical protein [Salmonella enterica subsp. enterica serovar Kentucky]